MYLISDEQVKEALAFIYRLNPGVQQWEAINKFFQGLKKIPEPRTEAENEAKNAKAK